MNHATPPSEAVAEPTIEEALAQLREMFPNPSTLSINLSDGLFMGEKFQHITICISGVCTTAIGANTLSETMQKVREWKANQ